MGSKLFYFGDLIQMKERQQRLWSLLLSIVCNISITF